MSRMRMLAAERDRQMSELAAAAAAAAAAEEEAAAASLETTSDVTS